VSTFRVPSTLIFSASARSPEPILYHPATWKTPSTPIMGPHTDSAIVTSPGRTCTPRARRSRARDGSRAIAITWCPSATSARATRPPMNPVAPVTRYFVAIRQATQYVDHNILQTGFENADDHRFLRSVCQRYGALFSGPGNGISHWAHMEAFDVPGETMLGCDSHTPHAGACGMLAIGAG